MRFQKRAMGLAFACIVWAIGPAVAQSDLKLGLPIDCDIGKTCWIVNLVDLDAGPGAQDYQCLSQTYDGHKGTDIAIRDLTAMQKGVRVLASAAGVVRGSRDGMADRGISADGGKSVAGRECGNGVVLAHGGGWETQYCHLRRGSVAVKSGDRISKGQFLGLVGQSGRAAFPHVHIEVRRGKTVVDPFLGPTPGRTCGLGAVHLWDDRLVNALTAPLTTIFSAGFAGVAPKTEAIHAGHYQDARLLHNVPALVLWAAIYNIRKGDRVVMRITGPDGSVLHEYESIIEKTQARNTLYSGRKRKSLYWPDGTYSGEISIYRKSKDGGEQLFQAKRQVVMH